MNIQLDFIKSILEQIKEPVWKVTKIAKRQWQKFKIKSKVAFTKCLENSYEKYSKIKTVYIEQNLNIYTTFSNILLCENLRDI